MGKFLTRSVHAEHFKARRRATHGKVRRRWCALRNGFEKGPTDKERDVILYASPMSPFSARVRFSLFYKDIRFDQIKPSQLGGMSAPEFLAVSPLGKIPVLELDTGERVEESDTIVEYLEDAFPTPSLRPDDPLDRARARLIARVSDLYVLSPLLWGGTSSSDALSTMMPISLHRETRAADPALVAREAAALARGLDRLDRLIDRDGPFAMGRAPTTADGALVPYLVFVDYAGRVLDRPDLLGSRPGLATYLDRVAQADPALARTREGVEQALVDRREEIAEKARAAQAPAGH
jgi:glutathione S-transferase